MIREFDTHHARFVQKWLANTSRNRVRAGPTGVHLLEHAAMVQKRRGGNTP